MKARRVEPLLGCPGAWIGAEEPPDPYATRVGGVPVFPGAAPPPQYVVPTCTACGSALTLVHQASVPLEAAHVGRQLLERCLLVFGCTQPGCEALAPAWRALRCQREPPQSHPPSTSEMDVDRNGRHRDAHSLVATAAQAAAASGSASSAWDVGFGVGDALSHGSSVTATFDFAELDAALDKAYRPASKAAISQLGLSGAGAPAEQRGVSGCAAPAGPQLPGFHLHARVEPGRGAVGLGVASDQAAHVAELLRQYRQQEGQAAEALEQASSEWVGEAYEPDSTRTADAAFLKFTRRLQRCPEQCVRYGFGVDVLWPAVQRPQPLPCPRCGGRRVLELQLMPGLLAALEEGLAWVELRDGSETGCTAGGAPPSLDHWTWLTIAVFTCANSCGGSSAEWTFAEEQVEMCIEQ